MNAAHGRLYSTSSAIATVNTFTVPPSVCTTICCCAVGDICSCPFSFIAIISCGDDTVGFAIWRASRHCLPPTHGQVFHKTWLGILCTALSCRWGAHHRLIGFQQSACRRRFTPNVLLPEVYCLYTLNRPWVPRGGRGEVERFVRLVNHEDVVQRGPNLARMLVHVSL